jgi:hypothetical protein
MRNAAGGDGRMGPAVHVGAPCNVSIIDKQSGGFQAHLLALCGMLRELPFGAEK